MTYKFNNRPNFICTMYIEGCRLLDLLQILLTKIKYEAAPFMASDFFSN